MTFFKNMKVTIDEVNKTDVKIRDLILTMAGTLVISILIYSGIIALSINLLMMYVDLHIFFAFFLTLVNGCLWYTIVDIYLKSVSQGLVKGIWRISLSAFVIGIILGIIVIVILFITGVLYL